VVKHLEVAVNNSKLFRCKERLLYLESLKKRLEIDHGTSINGQERYVFVNPDYAKFYLNLLDELEKEHLRYRKKIRNLIFILIIFVMSVIFSFKCGGNYQESLIKQELKIVKPVSSYTRIPNKVYSKQTEIKKTEKSLGKFKITAYTHGEPGDHWGLLTASGENVKEGRTIAVDPDVIPLGSIVKIEGVGERVAVDVGGLVKGKHIDLYFDSKEEMNNWGRQFRKVTLLKRGEGM
jgi:3D (Asp-Asp-Asp) domain-containing protein